MSELLIKNTITGEWEAIPYIVGPQGPQGEKGDTGLRGVDGITPHIGENGNWHIGEADTGKPSAPQEAILYTPQSLTHEQQAQARENLGIDQLLPGDANQETVLVDFTASEPVGLVDIPLSEEQVKAIVNANIVSYRLTLFGDETATDTTGLGTAQLCYWCNQGSGWQIGFLLPKTANAVASAENKKWAVGNYNGFILQSPFINNSDIGKHTNSHNNYPQILVGKLGGTEVKQVTEGGSVLSTSKNVSLRLETSLPIGTGSRIILTIR